VGEGEDVQWKVEQALVPTAMTGRLGGLDVCESIIHGLVKQTLVPSPSQDGVMGGLDA